MSYASLYWRKFMWGEEFSSKEMEDSSWVKNVHYPDGEIIYNRYTLAYLWRMIILIDLYEGSRNIDFLELKLGPVFLERFVDDLARELFYSSEAKVRDNIQDATWQGYESKKELEDLEMLFYDLYSGDIAGAEWRIEDFYGIGLDLFFESTCFCYILQESQKTMFKPISPRKRRKSPELGNIYDLGSGPPWNNRVSFDAPYQCLYQCLWFAYRVKDLLMYGQNDRHEIFQALIDLAQKTDFGWWDSSEKKIAEMKPSAENFDALMVYADNLFMGQLIGQEDRWTRYHRPVQPLFFEDELYPIENGKQASYIDAYKDARRATEAYLHQRRNFFDGIG